MTSDDVTLIGPAVRADFRRLYPANAKTPTCCPSDDNRTKVTNSVTSAPSLWWHVGPYFWPADLTRTANPIYCIQRLDSHSGVSRYRKVCIIIIRFCPRWFSWGSWRTRSYPAVQQPGDGHHDGLTRISPTRCCYPHISWYHSIWKLLIWTKKPTGPHRVPCRTPALT